MVSGVDREVLLWSVRRRIVVAMVAMMAVMGLLLFRAWYLQVLSHEKYAALAQNNRIRAVVEKPERGRIFDRQGRELASNEPSFNLALVLDDVDDLEKTVEQVARLLDVAPEPILEYARRQRRQVPYLPVTVRKGLSLAQVAEIEWAHLPGVKVAAETERRNNYGTSAAHVLGYVGEVSEEQLGDERFSGVLPGTRVGQYGVEYAFDETLRGIPGTRRIEVDAKGFEVRELTRDPSMIGNDIYLTLDIDVQQAAEQALGKESGAVVALDPETGQVLALVSSPAFEPEALSRGVTAKLWRAITTNRERPLLNRAIQGIYPPGSTFKIPVAAAIIEQVKGGSFLHCGGQYAFLDRVYRDWKVGGHGSVGVHDALVESCDVFFYEYGHQVGIDVIADYAGRFGFGQRTGIDLPGERTGILPSTAWKAEARGEIWYPGETLLAAIGQGYVSSTPLQVAAMMGAIGADGQRFEPTVRLGVWNSAESRVELDAPRPLPPAGLRASTYRTLHTALAGVVKEPKGTGKAARSQVVDIAGKSGTAQVVSLRDNEAHLRANEIPRSRRDHAWFTAYAPAQNPVIAVAVLVEHGGSGGSHAAPIAKQVIEAYMAARAGYPPAEELPHLFEAQRAAREGV